jgi:hypothetical protein
VIIEQYGNILDFWREGNLIGITTNGFVKNNGRAVMGRGIALSIRDEITDFDLEFGQRLTQFGNQPFLINEYNLFTFPVKHKWNQKADIDLIADSARKIEANFCKMPNVTRIDFPRPGCGNGRLDWSDVKPVLEEIFVSRPTYVWSFGAKG